MDDLIQAKATRAAQQRIMRWNQSFEFRLNAVLFTGIREGKVWPVTAGK